MIFAQSFFEHVLDARHWEIFESLDLSFNLPAGLSKFIVLQMMVAVILCAIFIPLARRVSGGEPPKGWFWNLSESLLTFVRDEVAVPCIGEHDANRFLPFLWTVFLYIAFNNLFGLIPFMGSATSSLWVTGALALCAAAVIHGTPIIKYGPWHYLKSYYPHIDAPMGLGVVIGLFIAVMEIIGHGIKTFVLAVRLYANIFAGHTVLAVILSFIVMAKDAPKYLFWPISFGSVLFIVALSLLELFVGLLQAYVFTFLSALFLGMTLHPEH
jgi:F-type H+-transporting ATPase subunit a